MTENQTDLHPTKEKQEKEPGTKCPGSTHFCPQCGQFSAF